MLLGQNTYNVKNSVHIIKTYIEQHDSVVSTIQDKIKK